MTKLKVGGLSAAALSALEPHVAGLYAAPGRRLVIVAELEHVERTQPGPNSDKEPSVAARFSACEVAAGEREAPVREAMRALYLQRTARGTLDEDSGAVELSEETIRSTAGLVHATFAAEAAVAMRRWSDYARSARSTDKATVESLRSELDRISKGLDAAALGLGD